MIILKSLTHGSHLLSQTRPMELIEFAKLKGLRAIGLTDKNNLHQCVPYYEGCKKEGLKPLIGMDIEELKITIYPRNLQGWRQLLSVHWKINTKTPIFDIEEDLDYNMVVIISKDSTIDLEKIEKLGAHIFFGINPLQSSSIEDTPQNFPIVPVTPNHFLPSEDRSVNQNINKLLLCKLLKIKLDDADIKKYPAFDSEKFEVKTEEDLEGLVLPEWSENTYKLLDLIEDFSILAKPELPHFECPDGMTEVEYLSKICMDSLKQKGLDSDKTYIDRIERELSVIGRAGMSGYFLIMGDIVRWARSKNIRVGCARGSAAGCLISYLTQITSVDPIQYGLIFERFYSADRGEYPDIDLDLQPSRRHEIEEYVKYKYGAERFMQFATFSTLKGRAALKLALTTSKKNISVDEQNEITKFLPEEAVIAEELKEQNNQWGNKSTVLWTVLNRSSMDKWCIYDSKTDKWDGTYSDEFQLGVKMNTVIQARGRHASAFVLSSKPMREIVPVAWDEKSNTEIIALDMDSGQRMGLVKLDLLGLKLLDEYNFSLEVLNGSCTVF